MEWNYLYKTKKIKKNLIKKLYIPNLYCFGDHDIEMWKQLDIKVKNFYPIGNLRLANFFHHIKEENNSPEKYNCDICLIAETVHSFSNKTIPSDVAVFFTNRSLKEGSVKLIEYTIKFCLKHNMKLNDNYQ